MNESIYKKREKYLTNKSLENFIRENQNNKIVPLNSAFFKKSYILNYYDKEYLNPKIMGKKDSLSTSLTELIAPKNIFGK